MLRLRFLPGLLIGLPLGALVTLLALPDRPDDATTSREIAQLAHRLEAADRDKRALIDQVEEFRALAERMTASFASLEARFQTLEKQAGDDVRAPALPPPSGAHPSSQGPAPSVTADAKSPAD